MPQLSQRRSSWGESGEETFNAASRRPSQRRQLIAVRGMVEPELADFAGAKRAQLMVLEGAAVTAPLREGMEGRTWVASVRRAEQEPWVSARHQAFTPPPWTEVVVTLG